MVSRSYRFSVVDERACVGRVGGHDNDTSGQHEQRMHLYEKLQVATKLRSMVPVMLVHTTCDMFHCVRTRAMYANVRICSFVQRCCGAYR